MIDRQLLKDLVEETKKDGSTDAFIYFFELFDLLCTAAETGDEPAIQDRTMRRDFRAFWNIASQGFSGFKLNRVEATYGGYKSAEVRRIMLEDSVTKEEAGKRVPSFAEWWAEQPDYTDEIGQNRDWYETACVIHDQRAAQTHLNPLDPPLAVSTNRIEKELSMNRTDKERIENGGGNDTEGERGNPVRGEPCAEDDTYTPICNELNGVRAAVENCIKKSNEPAIGVFLKRYGLQPDARRFLESIKPDSDFVEQMASYIVASGGRMPSVK